MSSLLYSLGRWAFRRRNLVVVGWILILAIAGGSALLLNKGTDDSFSIPGTESQTALDRLATTFPQVSGASAQLVVVAADGSTVRDADYRGPIDDVISSLDDIEQVDSAVSPFDKNIDGAISDDGKAALINIQLTGEQGEITAATKDEMHAAADAFSDALPSGSEALLGGQLFSNDIPGVTPTEAVGLIIALIVLLVTFGSFAAAGMPLASAILGAGISMALIFVATAFGPISATTPLLALMLGLAVGIDYALFIISRHQDQLRHGVDPEESAARAVATAGSAVIFAGLTVVIALVGLSVANIPFLTTMGVAAAVSVALAVVISLTLIPALLGYTGNRLAGKPRKAKKARKGRRAAAAEVAPNTDGATAQASAPKPNRFFAAWVRIVTRRPLITVLAVIGVLGMAIIPASQLKLALPDAGSLPSDSSARQSYDLVAEHFGEGFNGPLIVTGSIIGSTDPLGLMDDIADEIRDLPGVASVPLATPNETADTGIIQVVPDGGPNSDSTKELVAELRSLHDHFLDTYNVDLSVTGFTAAGIDISDRLGDALLPFGILVVGLSLLLLMMVFRSVAVPIKATIGYLLSVVASFGVVAGVFELGWFNDILHIEQTGPVISFMPILLMGVLFGLAMDYEVFLVARMREDYVHGKSAKEAVTSGFQSSAKVVTAAAIIMFAVFAAFVPEGDGAIKPIALGLAVGVFVDAFIVRMTFVPAVLVLLGDKAWWLPRWLDRILPSFDVEGENLQRELDLADWPEPGSTDAIAAEDLVIGTDRTGAPLVSGVSVRVPDGGLLAVTGLEARQVSAVLLAFAGRAALDSGTLKVSGLVAGSRSAGIRSRAAYVRIADPGAAVAAINAAAAERPRVLIIDGADALAEPLVRAEAAAAIDAARRAADIDSLLTVVIGGASHEAITALAPLTVPTELSLDNSADRAEVLA